MSPNSPKIVLDGELFELDRAGQVFVQIGNSRNVISFSMPLGNSPITFLFDSRTVLNATRSHQWGNKYRVSIPGAFLGLAGIPDRETVAGLQSGFLPKRLGFGIVDEPLNRRIMGTLPQIDLGGRHFYIDWRMREMRAVDDFTRSLHFTRLQVSPDGRNYLFFYNTVKHEVEFLGSGIKELPKNVVLAEIPEERVLDPVAVSRELGLGNAGLYPKHPMSENLKAKFTPLHETRLPEIIASNFSEFWSAPISFHTRLLWNIKR